jgi:hypothetical protein
MRHRYFLILSVIVIITAFVLLILRSVGISIQISLILLWILAFCPVFVVSFGIFVIIKRFSSKITKASTAELRREDDVLLEAVAFSQSLLLLLVNLTSETEYDRLLLTIMIASFAVIFYAVRAWAKIKDSAKYRYYSMYVLGFVSGDTVLAISLTITKQFVW